MVLVLLPEIDGNPMFEYVENSATDMMKFIEENGRHNLIEANNIVINFTGRYPDPELILPIPASPHFNFKTTESVKDFSSKLNLY